MTSRRHIAVGAAALAIAGGVAAGLVLAFSGSSAAAPTKAQYFARVTEICNAYGPKLDAVAPPPDVSIPGEVATPLRKVIPLLRAENAQMHRLRPPRELAAKVGRWLALKDRVLATLERALAAAEEPNISRTAIEYIEFLSLARQTAKLGHEIGFPSICSSSS